MADIHVTTTFKLRRGSSAAWTRNNPILQDGEPGYELDTGKLKIGDGTTAWRNLNYFGINTYTKQEIDDLLSNIESKDLVWGLF